MEELRPVLSRHVRRLLAKANVVGAGLGYKTAGGRRTEVPAVVVLVTRKMALSRLGRGDWIPKMLTEVETDVIEVGEIRILPGFEPVGRTGPLEEESRTKRLRPARPGVSVGHFQVTAGTFGALVYDRETRRPLILSNNHVLANITDGRDGRAQAGDPVYQPGRYDGGGPDDTLAHLDRFVPLLRESAEGTCPVARGAESALNRLVGLVFPGYRLKLIRRLDTENLVDAAVAALIDPKDAVPEIMGVGPVVGTAAPEVGMKVLKSGRTSGVSTGEIVVVGAWLRVSLGEVGSALFADQIVTSPLAEPGDSGSLVVTQDDHRAVGLLSAGSAQATVLGRIDHVLELLKVTLG